jgi:hypothetical protein
MEAIGLLPESAGCGDGARAPIDIPELKSIHNNDQIDMRRNFTHNSCMAPSATGLLQALLLLPILLLLGVTTATAPCSSGPGAFGITSPLDGSTLLSNTTFNITWSTNGSSCSSSSSRLCIIGDIGNIQLHLRQYFRGYGTSATDMCTNFTSILLNITNLDKDPNTGSFLWDIPGNITSDNNYLISGYIVDPERQWTNGVQSGLFSIKKSMDEVIAGDDNSTASSNPSSSAGAPSSAASPASTQNSTHVNAAAPLQPLPLGHSSIVLLYCVFVSMAGFYISRS